MLILILVNVQYIQNVVFSFQKGTNGLNDSSLDSHHLSKKIPQQNFLFPMGDSSPMQTLKALIRQCTL